MPLSIEKHIEDLIPALGADRRAMLVRYYEMLIEWNRIMNLTAITQPLDVAQKHFADSLLALEHIPQGASCVDVGTGAGFPGIPIMIARADVRITLMDALGKRIKFLTAVCADLGLDCERVHTRAEDAGRNPAYREKFDISLTRAVAQTNVLVEWTVPLLRVGGKSIMYKGEADGVLDGCENALAKLNCATQVVNCDCDWGKRSLVIAKKLKPTAQAYPRSIAEIKHKPL